MKQPKFKSLCKSFAFSEEIRALDIQVIQERMVACAMVYNSWIQEFEITSPMTKSIGRMYLILKAHGFRRPVEKLREIFKPDYLELIETVARDMEGWASKISERTKEPRMKARKAQASLPCVAAKSNFLAQLDPAVPKGTMYPMYAF